MRLPSGLATLAAGLLCSTRSPIGWATAAPLCTLRNPFGRGEADHGVACPWRSAFFVLVADGLRTTLRYVLYLIGSGIAFAVLCFVLFRPARDFLFNTVTLRHTPGPAEEQASQSSSQSSRTRCMQCYPAHSE